MAEDKRISELYTKTSLINGDLLVVYDSAEALIEVRTKNITAVNLFASPRPIGSTTPSTGSFTTLSLPDSATIQKFSIDGTLIGNSDTSLVTEKAIKTYVAAQIVDVETGIQDKIVKENTSVTCYDSTSVQGIIFSATGLPVTEEVVSTYYFNGYDTTDWLFPDNMVDGTTTTFSRPSDSPASYAQYNNSNTSPTLTLGTISSVRLRILGYYITGTTLGSFSVQPVFNGTSYSDVLPVIGIPADTEGYSAWIDLTSVVNAPVSWDFDDVANMDLIIENVVVDLGYRVSKIDIEVTYLPDQPDTTEIFKVTNNGVSIYAGPIVSNFSIDGTFASNSDGLVPTEKAIKTYITSVIHQDKIWKDDASVEIDNEITSITSNSVVVSKFSTDEIRIGTTNIILNKEGIEHYMAFSLAGYDVNAAEFDENVLIYLTEELQTMGKISNATIIIDDDASIKFAIQEENIVGISYNGIKLKNTITCSQISNDDTLINNSETSLVTEYAVKGYVDATVGNTIRNVYSDSTAVNSEVLLVDSTTGNILITVLESSNSKYVIKKISSDLNTITIEGSTGTIDGSQSRTLSNQYDVITLVSDGINLYII